MRRGRKERDANDGGDDEGRRFTKEGANIVTRGKSGIDKQIRLALIIFINVSVLLCSIFH